jgi:hypothetical protein
MKYILLLVAFVAAVSAFSPLPTGVRVPDTALCAKHVNDKAAKWAKSKRPRKSRPSDINRAPVVYALDSLVKPAEYDISSEPAAPMAKPAVTEN